MDKPLMGTLVRIEIFDDIEKRTTDDLIEKAFRKFEKVITRFSRFDDNSELSKINKSGGKWTKASPEFMKILQVSLNVTHETKNVFDPTIIDLLKAYGYENSFNPEEIEAKQKSESFKKELKIVAKNRPGPWEIEIDENNLKIKLAEHQQLDFGASAKGYAIDLAKDLLIKAGIQNFLINAGGDLWAGTKKKAALFDPRTEKKDILGNVEIKNEALAGSGSFAKRVGIFHHLINSKSTEPENKVLQTYVIAPTAMEADIYSTVLFLLGEDGIPILDKYKFRYLIISEKGIIRHDDLKLL